MRIAVCWVATPLLLLLLFIMRQTGRKLIICNTSPSIYIYIVTWLCRRVCIIKTANQALESRWLDAYGMSTGVDWKDGLGVFALSIVFTDWLLLRRCQSLYRNKPATAITPAPRKAPMTLPAITAPSLPLKLSSADELSTVLLKLWLPCCPVDPSPSGVRFCGTAVLSLGAPANSVIATIGELV